jgi:hypothetical protein
VDVVLVVLIVQLVVIVVLANGARLEAHVVYVHQEKVLQNLMTVLLAPKHHRAINTPDNAGLLLKKVQDVADLLVQMVIVGNMVVE